MTHFTLIEKISGKIETVFVFLFCLFLFSLPFGDAFSKVIIVIFMIFWLFWLISKKFRVNIEVTKQQKIIFSILILYYILHFIGIIYSDDKIFAYKNIFVKIYIVLIPLVVLTSAKIWEKNIKIILSSFILGVFVSSIYMYIRALFRSVSFVDGKLLFNAAVDPTYSFFKSVSFGGNHFFYSDFSAFGHPSYISIIILVAIIILMFGNSIFSTEKHFFTIFLSNKKISYILILFFSLTVLFLSSRANFIALIIILGFRLITLNFKMKYPILLAMFFVSVFYITRNERFELYLNYISQPNQAQSTIKSGTQRYYIWKTGFKIIKKNPLFGVGTGDVRDCISPYFVDSKLSEYNNLHNEFIETQMRLGVLGTILFLSFFFINFWLSIKRKNYIMLYVIIILFVNFFFESMLDRLFGALSFGTFISLSLLFYDDKIMIYAKRSLKIDSSFVLFIAIFVYLVILFKTGLQFTQISVSSSYFSISDFLHSIWNSISNIHNLLWYKLFNVFILSFSFVILYNLLNKIFKNRLLPFVITVFGVVLVSLFNVIYFNSLLYLVIVLLVKTIYSLKNKTVDKRKKWQIISVVLLSIIFANIVFDKRNYSHNLLNINSLFVRNHTNFEYAKDIFLLGIYEDKLKVKDFENLMYIADSVGVNQDNYCTNIKEFPYLFFENGHIYNVNLCDSLNKNEYCILMNDRVDNFIDSTKVEVYRNDNFTILINANN